MSLLRFNKKWVWVIIAFIVVRVIIFSTFWDASADKGGWENFYSWSQPAQAVFMEKFHESCDWRPPLYYTFTSAALFLFGSQWAIYFLQLLLTFAALIIGYKIIRLFFSERIAFWATFIWAIEPFWAWQNFQIASENLYIPIFMLAVYFMFNFLKKGNIKYVALSSLFFAVAAYTRPTALLLPAFLTLVLGIIFIFKNKIKLEETFFKKRFKDVLIALVLFNLIFLAILTPWLIRNKIIYGRLSFANLSATNVYYYNLPPLLAIQKGISYKEGYDLAAAKAENDLGALHLATSGWDCFAFTKEDFNSQLDYYSSRSRNYILKNLKDYIPLHLFKMIPFFVDSGYFDLYSAYTGEYSKPDITAAFMKGDLKDVKNFITTLNFKLVLYVLGIVLWLVISIMSFVAIIYALLKDKSRFMFFAVTFLLAAYTAFLTSPFNFARYRLPLYLFFFTSLLYIIAKIHTVWQNKRKR